MADLEDQWRQVEDDDWPSQLVSSIENDTGSPAPIVSAQPNPLNLSFLARPVSSSGDPAAGFSFAKAKPLKPLDFGRKTGSSAPVPIASAPTDGDVTQRSTAPNVASPPKEVFTRVPSPINEGDDTLVGSDVDGSGGVPAQTTTVPEPVRPLKDASVAVTLPANGSHTTQAVQTHAQCKGNKPRKKKRQSALASRGGPLKAMTSTNPASEEHLLQLLQYKQRRNAEERETLQAEQQAKEAELQHLAQASSNLYSQLQEMTQRHDEKESQLAKFEVAKSSWSTKYKKLSDFVKGLGNDYNRLRDDSRVIQERQGNITKDKEDLHNELRQIHYKTEQQHTTSKELVTDARHDLEILGQRMQHQQEKLQEDKVLLISERERNNRLEEQIATFTTSQAQLLNLFAGHRDTIIGKLNELLTKAGHAQAALPQESQDDLKPMLEQCVSLLQGMPKVDGGMKAEDMEKLNESMSGYFEGVTRSIEACEHTTTAIEAGQQQLASSMQGQLQALNGNIATEQALSEQIMELREMKATIRERLQTSETSLRDARLQVVTLQHKDSEQSGKILSLEADARNCQPDAQTLLRLQGIDSLNKELRIDLATRVAEAKSLLEQIQHKEDTITNLRDQYAQTLTSLEAARQQAADGRKQIEQYEQKMSEQRTAHDSLQQMYHEIQADNRSKTQAINDLQRSLRDIGHQNQTKDTLNANLQQSMQRTTNENDNIIKNLRRSLEQSNSENAAKDNIILCLRSKIKRAEEESAPVVEDSQPREQPRFASLSELTNRPSTPDENLLDGIDGFFMGTTPAIAQGKATSEFSMSVRRVTSSQRAESPRGTLKPNTQELRGQKRNAGASDPVNASKRRMSSQVSSVVADSQASISLVGRAQTQTKGRKRTQDKFTKRFDEALNH